MTMPSGAAGGESTEEEGEACGRSGECWTPPMILLVVCYVCVGFILLFPTQTTDIFNLGFDESTKTPSFERTTSMHLPKLFFGSTVQSLDIN